MDRPPEGMVPLGVLHSTDTGAVPARTVQLSSSDSVWLMMDGAEIAICGGSGRGGGGKEGEVNCSKHGILCTI